MKKLASTLRWRLKPVRWMGKAANSLGYARRRRSYRAGALGAAAALDRDLAQMGYAKLARSFDLPEIDLAELKGLAKGKSFVDVSDRHPRIAEDVFSRIVNDPELAGTILRYFDGEPWLWNVGLNYSDPSQGQTDSQLWHFDYGDVRQLHILVYFSNIDATSGPFTFLEAPISNRVARHPLLIERRTDEQLRTGYAIDIPGDVTQLVGKRGDVFLNDPGRLMHQGARCEKPRLVMFVSFTTPAPMSKGGHATISREARARLIAARENGRGEGALPSHMLLA